jgi:hypothetical protein
MKTEQQNVTGLGILHVITFARDLFNSMKEIPMSLIPVSK